MLPAQSASCETSGNRTPMGVHRMRWSRTGVQKHETGGEEGLEGGIELGEADGGIAAAGAGGGTNGNTDQQEEGLERPWNPQEPA